jgi:transcriptional regulator with XRE-family HTH domain
MKSSLKGGSIEMPKKSAKTHEKEYEQFGKNLSMLRISRGLSQYEIAEKLRMPQSTYAGYETGTRKVPLSVILQLCKFFDVRAGVLIGSESVSDSSAIISRESEKHLLSAYRRLNSEGRQKLTERADELIDLRYTEKGDKDGEKDA